MSQSAAWDNVSVSTRDEKVIFSENQEPDNYKNANYIPSRHCARCPHAKYLYIACSILVVLILIIIVITALTKSDGQKTSFSPASGIKTSKNLSDYRGDLILIVNDTLGMKFNHSTRKLDLVFKASSSNIIAIDVDVDNDNMYYTDAKATWFIYQRDENPKLLLKEKRFKPEGLALDRVTGNIYVLDQTAGNLIVINRYSGNYAILLTDVINARDVLLDSKEGLLFILQHSHSILRANMDGFTPEEIVRNDKITSLTVDTSRKRLYWISDFVNIKSSNYDGNKEQIFFTDTVAIADITILDNHLLWIYSSNQQSANFLLSCQIDVDDICNEHATHKINTTGNIKIIRGYSTFRQSIPNPCKINNGGCEKLCLLSGSNKSSCACHMGWQLNADNRTCEEVRDFVLYPYDGVVRTCTLDGKRELFWPTPYLVDKLTVKTEIDFEYDLKNDYFYFSDDHNIHRTKLKTYTGQEVILSVNSSDMIIDDIAYDWFTGNMYYGQRHVDATLEHSLVVFNTRLGESYRKSIKIFDQDDMKARSYAMALHPTKGYLFVAVTHEGNDINTYIYRINMDGADYKNKYHHLTLGVKDYRFFAIDYANDRLYAIQSNVEKKALVSYKEIDNTGTMHFSKQPFTLIDARTIAVHQQWLYLSNYSRIYRFDKEDGGNGFAIAPRVESPAKIIVGVRIISEEVQFYTTNNTCAKNNGGCEQFCFSGYKVTCDCKDGQRDNGYGHCFAVD